MKKCVYLSEQIKIIAQEGILDPVMDQYQVFNDSALQNGFKSRDFFFYFKIDIFL